MARNIKQKQADLSGNSSIELFPFLHNFKAYRTETFVCDLFAGLNVSLLIFPQAMAYALLVELPIEYGLYGAILACIASALFSHSAYVNFGPTNSTSVLLMSSFAMLGISTQEMPMYLPTLLLLVGLFLILSACFNVARLVQYISRSVIFGYITAIVFIVMANQAHHILGFNLDVSPQCTFTFLDTCKATLQGLEQTNLFSVGIGLTTAFVYYFIKRFYPKLPCVAFTMLVLVGIVFLLQSFCNPHIQVLNPVHLSAWDLSIKNFNLDAVTRMADPALIISFICLIDGTTIVKTLSARSGKAMNLNQIVYSLGFANLFCGAFSGMPISGSLVRSAANYTSGAKTSFASLLCALFCLLFIVCLGDCFSYIPKAGLATLIILLVAKLINPKVIKIIITSTRSDACVFFITFFSTFIFPLNTAIYLGIFLSIALFLRKAAMPVFYEYTYDENDDLYEAPVDPNHPQASEIAILHIEGNLFFGSSEFIQHQMKLISKRTSLKVLILKMRNVQYIDASCILDLEELLHSMYAHHRILLLSEVNEHVFQSLKRSQMADQIGLNNIFKDDRKRVTLSTARALKRARDFIGNNKARIRVLSTQLSERTVTLAPHP